MEQKYIFRGRVVRLRVDRAAFPNGKTVTREVCEHCPGVGVLPIAESGVVSLVRQYRYPYGEELLEIPAGKLEWGTSEEPEAGASRELREETGLSAGRFVPMGALYPSPGCMDEVLYLYLALALSEGEACPDEDEFLNVVRMPLSELIGKIMAGEIRDAKTIAAAFKAEKLWDGGLLKTE